MKSSRRKFMRDSMALFAGGVAANALAPSFSFAQTAPGEFKNVVWFYLNGGMDDLFAYHMGEGPAFDTVIDRRPNLAVSRSALIAPNGFSQNGRQNTRFFHPRFFPLVDALNATSASACLIEGSGVTARNSFSHDVARNHYHNGTSADNSTIKAGWFGRIVDQFDLEGKTVWAFRSTTTSPKLALVSQEDQPFVVSTLADVDFRNANFGGMNCNGLDANGEDHPCQGQFASASEESVLQRDFLRRLQDASEGSQGDLGATLARNQKAMFEAVPLASRMRDGVALNVGQFRGRFNDDSGATGNMQDIAKAIHYLNLSGATPASTKAATKLFYCQHGGFDTHSSQAFNQGREGNLPDRLERIAQALAGLIYHLEQWGLMEDTIIMVNSEFGRTLAQNGSVGTDHAWSAASMVIGGRGKVRSGVVGPEPDADEARDSNRFTAQVPFDGILRQILSSSFDPAGLNAVFPSPLPGSVPNFLL